MRPLLIAEIIITPATEAAIPSAAETAFFARAILS